MRTKKMFDVHKLGIDPKNYQVRSKLKTEKTAKPKEPDKKPERCLPGYCKHCTLETENGIPRLWCGAGSARVFDFYDKGACPLGFWYRAKGKGS